MRRVLGTRNSLLTTLWLRMLYVLLHKVAHCNLHFPFLITKYVGLKLNLKFGDIKFDILLDASLRQLRS